MKLQSVCVCVYILINFLLKKLKELQARSPIPLNHSDKDLKNRSPNQCGLNSFKHHRSSPPPKTACQT